jgi:hypothetical protein
VLRGEKLLLPYVHETMVAALFMPRVVPGIRRDLLVFPGAGSILIGRIMSR